MCTKRILTGWAGPGDDIAERERSEGVGSSQGSGARGMPELLRWLTAARLGKCRICGAVVW